MRMLTAVRGPAEGLTVGPNGDRIYAASNGAGSIANLFVFDPSGNFYIAQNTCNPDGSVPCSVPIQGSSPDVLGIRFNPSNVNGLWVLDVGQILEINPATGVGVRLAIEFDPRNVLNGITFDGKRLCVRFRPRKNLSDSRAPRGDAIGNRDQHLEQRKFYGRSATAAAIPLHGGSLSPAQHEPPQPPMPES